MINLLNHLTINSHNVLASKGSRWQQAYCSLLGHTDKRPCLFKTRPLVCWRADLVFLNLRACFLSMLKAMHLIWVAVKNNNRVVFVNHAGPLDNLAHCSAIDQLIKKQLQRSQLPRLKRLPFWGQKGNKASELRLSLFGQRQPSKRNPFFCGRVNKAETNAKFNQRLAIENSTATKKVYNRLSHSAKESVKSSKPFRKIKTGRRPNGHTRPKTLALGLNKLLSICSARFKKAPISESKNSGAQIKGLAITLRRGNDLLQAKAVQLSSRLHAEAYGGAAMGWFSNSDPTLRTMFNHLIHRPLGLSNVFLNNSDLISTDYDPYTQTRPRRYSSWTTRLPWLNRPLRLNFTKFKRAGSKGFGPAKAFASQRGLYPNKMGSEATLKKQKVNAPSGFFVRAKKNASSYQRLEDRKLLSRDTYAKKPVLNGKLTNAEGFYTSAAKPTSIQSFAHRKFWHHQMFGFDKARFKKRSKYASFGTAWLCPNHYNQIMFANSMRDYERFAKNPMIGQTGIVIFSHPEKAMNLVNQVKQLGIPTVGFISGNSDPTQKTHTPVDFPIIGNPENYHLHSLILRNFISLVKRASSSTLKKKAILA